jgi:methylated-DNA-[protein]-cysteine S-methyltransferase
MHDDLYTTTMPTPIGELRLVASDRGLRAVLLPGESPTRIRDADPAVDSPEHPLLRAAVAQLDEYFAGRRTEFDIPLDPVGSPFQQRAWAVLRSIPFGSTMSYGEQARRLGDPHKARAVGAANGKNPISIIVPCHRVVATNGSLTGYAGGVSTKAWLLDHERDVVVARTAP